MSHPALEKHQFWLLVFLSAWFLWAAPEYWHFSPDSGVYVGTAESLVESGQYRFNGHPNLLYYPGFSALLSAPIFLLGGVDFQVLHLLCVALGVLGLWLARAYFQPERYGWPGLLLPLLLACHSQVYSQVFAIVSDGTFLAASLAALLAWRTYEKGGTRRALAACFAITMYASLVRFQGLFLCAAFAGALALRALREHPLRPRRVAAALALGVGVLVPFALWTWRNVAQHTPDTFNMANQLFFGLEGLALYEPGFYRVEWIQQEWLYGVHNLFETLLRLPVIFFSRSVVGGGTTIALGLLLAAVFAGSGRWFRRASGMERVYVLLSLATLFGQALTRRNLYVVPRYWLPLLPFVLIAGMLGLERIHEYLKRTRLQPVFAALLCVLGVLALLRSFQDGVPWGKAETFRKTVHVMEELAEYVDQHVEPDAVIATTDWGVLPWMLERTSYQVLNDPSHRLTFERMERYQTRYLAILVAASPFALSAQQMVRDLPELFTELEVVWVKGFGPRGWLYAVDLAGVSEQLARESQGKHFRSGQPLRSDKRGPPPGGG